MATEYRDYGQLNYTAPREVAIEEHRRQVYQATHRGDGSRLPLMYRSFISFTYGGKPIEDFDLIATIQGDRLQKSGYATFEDTVTTYENLDGQFYWSTHYKQNSLTFSLATDGIDQKTLDEFLYWFHAGEAKELILSEHPNRAIMARVAQPPTLSLLPFEQDVEVMIASNPYKTKTTLYKGEITLEMVMDEPHWYAIQNIIGVIAEVETDAGPRKRYLDKWLDTSLNPPQEVDVFASADALKIIQEDGIPLGTMVQNNMLLGNGAYADVENNVEGLIWSLPEAEIEYPHGDPTGFGARIDGHIYIEDTPADINLEEVTEPPSNDPWIYTQLYDENGNPDGELAERPVITDEKYYLNDDDVLMRYGYAKLSRLTITDEEYNMLSTENDEELMFDKPSDFIPDEREYSYGHHVGIIAGAIVDITGDGITILYSKNDTDTGHVNAGHFFYAGTAPSPTIITFTLEPTFDNDYISIPANSYTNPEQPYNTFTITSKSEQSLQFTTPNLYTSFNRAIYLFKNRIGGTYTWESIFDEIRDTIRHPAVRAWASYVLSGLRAQNPNRPVVDVPLADALRIMKLMMTDASGTIYPVTFSFDSKSGTAVGDFKYHKANANLRSGAVIPVSAQRNLATLERINDISVKRNYIINWIDSNELFEEYTGHLTQGQDETLTAFYTRQVNAFYAEISRRQQANLAMEATPPILVIDYQISETSTLVEASEDVGDMLYSNYLIIRDRNYPTSYGNIAAWTDFTEDGKSYSHKITHDIDVPIHHLQIMYKNMYL